MTRALHILFPVALLMVLTSQRLGAASNAAGLWSAHVQPLLAEHCFKCHSSVELKSGLDLSSPSAVLLGGDGGPVVVPGHPEKSSLFLNLQPGADPHMPPKGKQLPPEAIAIIERWITRLSPDEAKVLAGTNPPPAEWNAAAVVTRRPPYVPPAGLNGAAVIDHLISEGWRQRNVAPGPVAKDRAFARRLYLDLAGRIPSTNELGSFVSDVRPDKRARLIDALLASDDYPVRMREVFDVVFMERGNYQTQRERRRAKEAPQLAGQWHEYLEQAFRTNRPWNAIVRDMVMARPEADSDRGAIRFLYARKENPQDMAEIVGSVFLGLQMRCAQCHHHPLAPEIKQGHYWGLVAAFNRSKAVESAAGPGLAESAIGGFVKYTNLKGASSEAALRFLDDTLVEEKWPAENAKEVDAPDLYLVPPPDDGKTYKTVPVPKVSRRAALADWLAQDNPLVARAFVNRTWALLFGRGLVHPVDRMDSSRPPSHPELVDWLAADFQAHGWDIKRLIRLMANSRAYQLDVASAPAPRPGADSFAWGPEKALTAEAYARALLVALGHAPKGEGNVAGADLEGLQNQFAKIFPDAFPIEEVATLRQAMFLTNNKILDETIQPGAENALGDLLKLAESARVKELFLRILSRPPSVEEEKRAVEYLTARSSEPATATRQLVWALVTGAEFRFNH